MFEASCPALNEARGKFEEHQVLAAVAAFIASYVGYRLADSARAIFHSENTFDDRAGRRMRVHGSRVIFLEILGIVKEKPVKRANRQGLEQLRINAN